MHSNNRILKQYSLKSVSITGLFYPPIPKSYYRINTRHLYWYPGITAKEIFTFLLSTFCPPTVIWYFILCSYHFWSTWLFRSIPVFIPPTFWIPPLPYFWIPERSRPTNPCKSGTKTTPLNLSLRCGKISVATCNSPTQRPYKKQDYSKYTRKTVWSMYWPGTTTVPNHKWNFVRNRN